jgi:hypothetical protein
MLEEVALSSDYGDLDMSELPVLSTREPSGPGRASQMSIPILRSEPVYSTITITSNPSAPITSDTSNNNKDIDMGGTQRSYH